MDLKEAISKAKHFLGEVYADEIVSHLGVEEVEYDSQTMIWTVGLSFSRPWATPRTRAQEVLEAMGGTTGQRRSVKIVKLSDAGDLLSMKNMAALETMG